MKNHKLAVPEVAGLLLCAFGALFAARWLFDLTLVPRFIPGSERLGIVNPLLFVGIGACFLDASAAGPPRPWLRRLANLALAALILLPLAYLFEAATDIPLGVDIVATGVVPTASNPYPGRISPNASLAFLATGLAFMLARGPQTRNRRWPYLALVTVISAIGMAGLAGHFLGLETLYQIASFNRILPITSFGLMVVAAGLFSLLDRTDTFDPDAVPQTERRINRRSLAVATLVAVSGGVAGFAVMRGTFEESVSQKMLLTATTNATSLAHAIEVSLWFPRTVATRPTVRQPLDKLSADPADSASKDFLKKVADSFLTAELTGADFYDAEGRLAASAGTMVRGQAQVIHPLSNAGQTAFLAWHNGYVLMAENDVVNEGRRVGRVLTEQRLPLFDRLLGEVRGADATADAAICSRASEKALCAPTRFRHTRFELPMFDASGQPALPIIKALLGERGVMFAKDPRGIEVVSAYAPIKDFGLGFAVKTDVDTLYAPLRPRLGYLAMALLGIIALAAYAQRSQVQPVLKRLVENEQRLKAILEEQSELISLATKDGKLTYVNPAYARHFGLTPADLIGANLYDHVEQADREAVRQTIAGVFRDGTPATSENRMRMRDGGERWVAWTNSVQRDGTELLLHSVGRDITERKRAELALLEHDKALERTGRVAKVGGWHLELATGYLQWTAETRRIHEVGPDFVPTLETAVAFYTPESQAVIAAAVQACKERGEPWNLELPLVTATGRSIWVHAQGQVECDDGVPVRLVGALQDITERKTLEQRLAESEKFVRQVTDSLPVRIAYVDRETRFRFINLAHCRRFSLPREQILGRRRAELVQGRSDEAVEAAVAGALAGQEQHFEFEEVVDGKPVRIESRLIPDMGEDGQVRGFYSTGVDITQRSAAERALRELTTIFDNTTDYVVQTDWRGSITYMNTAARQALGLGESEPLGHRHFAEFNTPETNRVFAEVIVPATKARGVWVGETTIYAAQRRVVPVNHMVIAHRGIDGRVSRYSAIMRDISDELAAKQEQDRQAATLRSVTEAIPAIVAVVGSDGRYRFVNSAFERWSGAQRASIVGRSLQDVLGRTDYERSRLWVERVLAGESVSFERDYPTRTVARHLAVSYIPLWLKGGEVDGFVGVAQDITQHKQEEVRLLQLAQRDALTGLLNRSGFEQFLEGRRVEAQGTQALALLYIDLDHFKPVNDTHGHPVGDELLRMFAQRLRAAVRPTDAVARLGGDEFAIALPGVGEGSVANSVAEKVIAAAKAPFEVGELALHVGASVGVAIGAESENDWQGLVARADAMLYRAKAAGRGRHAGVSTPSDDEP